MSERPTPETDRFRKDFESHYANISDLFEYAEYLERDRDEWKQVANGDLLGAIKERDEALEALKGVLRVADRKTVEFDAARIAVSKATGKDRDPLENTPT